MMYPNDSKQLLEPAPAHLPMCFNQLRRKDSRVLSICSLRHLLLVIVGLSGILTVLATSAQAAILNNTGILKDMGVVVNSGNNTTTYFGAVSNGQNITGQTNIGPGFLYYNIEDQDDNATTSGFVGPRSGGQNYDAEFLGVLFNGNTISIGILTGQRFDNTLTNFSPGDIRIRTTLGEFWVEVGGSGNGSDGVSLGENGSTYTLNGSGFTSSVNNSEAIKAGTIVKNPSVINAVPAFNPAVPVQIDPNTNLNQSKTFTADSYSYTYYAGSEHAGIEVKFDAASVFGVGNTISSVEWRPSCGNDEVLYLGMNRGVTPEPASFLIWGGIGLGTAFVAWRKRKAMKLQNC